MMKRYILPIYIIGLLSTACTDDYDTAVQPISSFTFEKSSIEANESMVLHFTGVGDDAVVFTGDEGHDYEMLALGSEGLVINKRLFTYSYSKPGIYKVVCVASSHGDMGNVLLTDTCSQLIRVRDDKAAIDKISAPQVLYDEVFAHKVNEADWLLLIPRKVKFKTSTPSITQSQKLKFYLESSNTQVLIDGEPYVKTKKYDLKKPLEIQTVAYEGNTCDYNLYSLFYGEFKSFAVGGVTGKIERTEYDYSVQYINVKVAQGTDLTQMVPKFTLYGDNEKVYLNGVEYATGTVTDFTEPVEFTFVSTCADKPELTATSKCTVTVTYK